VNPAVLRYLPNFLTVLRLVLALPLGVFILRENYSWALGTSIVAGLSDALDGLTARRLGLVSQFGAALDPIADKLLIIVSFVCLAQVGLVPWYLAAAVIIRDLVIVTGAICYYMLIGPFEFASTGLSKSNLLIQISYCVLILLSQVIPSIPVLVIDIGTVAVLFITTASGVDYVIAWTVKAIQSRKAHD
jgi:cardiolipin synthase